MRTLEGTPLKVDLYVKGKLNTGNYTAFHMKYGDDWMFYLRQYHSYYIGKSRMLSSDQCPPKGSMI